MYRLNSFVPVFGEIGALKCSTHRKGDGVVVLSMVLRGSDGLPPIRVSTQGIPDVPKLHIPEAFQASRSRRALSILRLIL